MTVCLSVLFPLLTTLKNFFDVNSVREFYKPLNLEENPFQVTENNTSDFLKELKTNKTTGIDTCQAVF